MSIGNDERIKSLVNKNFEFGRNTGCWEVGIDDDGFLEWI
jgi:hypothetical protein